MKYFALFAFLFASSFLNAQVGIYTNGGPGQVVEVKGKIKIGNDGTTPTAGTMRYSSTVKQFQGYDGTEWINFSQQANGPLPSQAIPVFSYENIISAGTSEQITFRDWDEIVYSTIPANKMIIVTGIYPSPNSAAIADLFYALSFNVYVSSNNALVPSTTLRISGYDNVSQSFSGGLAPLLVVKAGQYLSVFSYNTSELAMSLSVRGFLVDDLSY